MEDDFLYPEIQDDDPIRMDDYLHTITRREVVVVYGDATDTETGVLLSVPGRTYRFKIAGSKRPPFRPADVDRIEMRRECFGITIGVYLSQDSTK